MSGKRTKRLRKECAWRLGRAPRKAEGHVTMRSLAKNERVRGRDVLRWFWQLFKPSKSRPRIDEFRFFKRRGCTPAEESTGMMRYRARIRAHQADVERNNEHMADLALEREALAAGAGA